MKYIKNMPQYPFFHRLLYKALCLSASEEYLMAKKNKKYFVLMEGGADTSQVFASAQPRGAALKAASRGKTNIRLRERGTKRVHVFTGERKQVPKPANGPDWLPDMVWKANVKKQGIEHQD